tara:strand:- start:2795 stop:3106 length:312 start_codon:yes stop_codon:yes gene_type:complete
MMSSYDNPFRKSYREREELAEIPYDNIFLQSIEKSMGELPIPAGTYDDLMLIHGLSEQAGEPIAEFTDAQQEALDEYEQVYYRFMEAGQAVIESFGYNAVYGE